MSNSKIFPDHDSVEEYCKSALRAALMCVKTSGVIDLDLFDYYNTFKDFREAIENQREKALSLISGLVPGQQLQEDFAQLDDDEQMDLLKDINATVLENVSYLLKETDGEKKPDIELVTSKATIAINTSWNRMTYGNSKKQCVLIGAKNISRPQFAFKDKIDNSNTAFVPVIKEKPNSIRPLAIFLEKDEEGTEEFCHPYECELEKFVPQSKHLQLSETVKPNSTDKTPFVYVETVDALKSLCEELKNQNEFALDLEHHSYRSFQGFTCLMQISTRDKDYIIDGISLRSDLWVLNEVFTDPKIVKVLHGGDMDIIWLQRDFGLYVVNMFDTGQAARVLNFAHLSLAFLVKHYCKVELNKQYQLSDWRIRPLPEELLKYAQEDTHYLLYVYDNMKNELIKKGNKFNNLLHSVFDRSKAICLKRYKKLIFSDDKYLELYKKSRKHFNPRQLFCLKELFCWRDKIARVEDESYGYILPNHMLLQISEVLPREHQGILASCNPVPPLVQQQLSDLFAIVSKANNMSLTQIQEPQEKSQAFGTFTSIDLNNMLHCPHDIHSYDDNRMHLHQASETSLISKGKKTAVAVPVKAKPLLSFQRNCISQKNDDVAEEKADKVSESIQKNNKTIFERYLMTKQYRANLGPEDDDKQKEKDLKKFLTQDANANTPTTQSVATESLDDNQTRVEENGQIDEDEEVIVESPLIAKKQKKKKRKQDYVEILDDDSPKHVPPPKKLRTPEQNSANFQPFDYSSVNSSNTKSNSEKSKNKNFQAVENVQNSKTPAKHHHRRKHNKQGSFNTRANRTQSGGRNWPTM